MCWITLKTFILKTFYFANKISLGIEGKCYKRYYKYPNIHQTFDVKSLNLLNSSRFLSWHYTNDKLYFLTMQLRVRCYLLLKSRPYLEVFSFVFQISRPWVGMTIKKPLLMNNKRGGLVVRIISKVKCSIYS